MKINLMVIRTKSKIVSMVIRTKSKIVQMLILVVITITICCIWPGDDTISKFSSRMKKKMGINTC